MSDSAFHGGRRGFVGGAALLAGAGLAGLDVFAAAPVAAGQVVDTASGKVRGTVQAGIHSFKGVPYGASTAGTQSIHGAGEAEALDRHSRVQALRSPVAAEHVVHRCAGAAGRSAPRASTRTAWCSNVWTPGVNDNRKRPVMFWIHGGGFAQESGSWPWIDGAALARRGDAVVITVNHRLNIFGYLHLATSAARSTRPPAMPACSTWWRRCNGCATTSRSSAAIPAM